MITLPITRVPPSAVGTPKAVGSQLPVVLFGAPGNRGLSIIPQPQPICIPDHDVSLIRLFSIRVLRAKPTKIPAAST